MSKLLDGLKTDSLNTFTHNGANTNATSLNYTLDLFFIAGASRTMSKEDIEVMLEKAYQENKDMTLKVIFWAGDIRSGAGERRFFKVALAWLEQYHNEVFVKLYKEVPVFNRWDSLFQFTENKEVLDYVASNVEKDSLLAKWMPREGKTVNKKFYNAFLAHTKLSPKDYRKKVVANSKTIENLLCESRFSEVEYSHVPSVAFSKYRKSFERNDALRFVEFLKSVEKGESKINAGAIFPHDIYKSLKNNGRENEKSINLQWKALPDYVQGSNEKILVMADTSGSMESPDGTPMAVSISLAIYLSERLTGVFKDHFMTFSASPVLQHLRGEFTERVRQMKNIVANTNIQKAFEVLLQTAIAKNVPVEDMPTKILVISDMEFDQGVEGETSFEGIQKKYASSGYELPTIVFWNVSGRAGNVPVKMKDSNVSLVSGASPSVIKGILNGSLTPESIMVSTLENERYSKIKA